MLKKFTTVASALALGALVAAPGFAASTMSGSMTMHKDPMVGGAAMYSNKTIVANAVNSKDHTTLVSLVKKAGLASTLSGPGPFTVFAPTNAAFAKVPSATLKKVGADKALLTKVLTYHVVPGVYTTEKLASEIKSGDGKATLKTVEGDDLTVTTEDGKFYLAGAGGGKAEITVPNVYQSNGMIQVVDGVLMP